MASRVLKKYDNKITQPYKKGTHNGIDIVGSNNGKSATDYIIAHSDGVVVKLEKNCNKTYKTGSSYGNYVKIKHENGYYTLYAHLKYGSVAVKVGDKVQKGDIIGYMGNTGHSSGAHLHFEVRNVQDIRIDPTNYIDKDLPCEWETGKYQLLVSKTIRTSCSLVLTNRVKVKQCKASVKPKLTSTNPNDIAKFKVGAKVDITEIIVKDGRIWGKMSNSFIVLCNQDNTPQAKRII